MVGGRGGSSKMNYKAVRNQKWKLFVKMSKSGKVSPTELYNLETDVSEKKNVLKQNQAIAKAMAADATVFLKELIKNKRPVGRVSK
jgi:predicted transcriptional regulator